LGTEEFERQMRALSVKADQADIAFERFFAGCRREVTSVTAVAGVADRDWVAFAGVSATAIRWTEACAESGTFLSLVKQLRDGMCLAEDGARQAWILPGRVRDLRHRYRLDWSGWDQVCR